MTGVQTCALPIYAAFPDCDHALALMLIDEILEIREVDDELVYIISVDNINGVC